VELSFWVRDYNDETHVDDAIFLSNDGGVTFAKAFDFRPGEWCEQYGQFPPLDLDQLAALAGKPFTDKYVVRFQQYGGFDLNNNSGNGDGLAIDDVCVYSKAAVYATLPFCDDFESGQLGDTWKWRFANETTTLEDFPTKPSNYVGVNSGYGYNSNFAVLLGKRCDDGPVSNALDLHLNLAGYTQAELNFWVQNYNDGTDVDDGIYFSNNGGATFEKAVDFEPSAWGNQYFQPPPLDLDMLATNIGVPFTDKFVVRFQQHGSYDFNNNGGNGDGFVLDDVCITEMPNAANDLLAFSEFTHLYPNPAYSTLSIVINDNNKLHFSKLKIFDLAGRLHLTQQLDDASNFHEVDVSSLGDGVYCLRLDGGGYVVHQRFVKVGR
jgi:hypothetical protein